MRSILGKLYQKVSNISLAVILTVSSLSVVGTALTGPVASAATVAAVCLDFTPNGKATQTQGPVTISTSDYWKSWNVTLASGYKLSSTSSNYANVRSGYTPTELEKSTTHPAYVVNASFTTQTSTVISNPGQSQVSAFYPYSYSYYLTTIKVCYLPTDTTEPNVYIKGDGNAYTPLSVGSFTYDAYRIANFKISDNANLASWSVNGLYSHSASGTWSDANNIQVGVNGGLYGTNTITVFDTTGNSKTLSFVLDNVGPTITPKSTSVGSISDNLFSKVDFKLYDTYQIAKYQVNTGLVHIQSANQWSDANGIAVGVNDGVLGNNVITVWDQAGNSSTYNFVLNNVGPDITVKSSVSGYTPYSIGSVALNVFSKINFKLHDSDKVTQFQVNSSPINNITDSVWGDANGISVGHYGGIYGENTITAWDLAGNSTTVTFYLDNKAPVVVATGGDLTLEAGDTYTEQGATWTDDVDGNGVINDADVSSDTVDTLVPGVYALTYTYTDSAGNVGTATRNVTVVDTTAPTVTLNGSNVTLTVGDAYSEQGATWTDIVDGSGTVTNITGSVDINTPGVYTVTYEYTDVAGNTATATRTVTVEAAPEVLGTTTTAPSAAARTFGTSNTGTTDANGEVKGDSTITDNTGSVKAASDTNNSSNGSTNTDNGSGNIFGLAWYWWVLILAAIAGLWWFLFGRRKKEDEE